MYFQLNQQRSGAALQLKESVGNSDFSGKYLRKRGNVNKRERNKCLCDASVEFIGERDQVLAIKSFITLISAL